MSVFRSEHVWKAKASEDIHALREKWRLGLDGVGFLDPGKTGALALHSRLTKRSTVVLMTDGLPAMAKWCREYSVGVLVAELPYVPSARPNMNLQVVNAQISSAMHNTRSGGVVLGYLAALLHEPPDLVLTQAATWQGEVLNAGHRWSREQRKAASLQKAREDIPEILATMTRAPDREGASDAYCGLQWWLWGAMR